MQTWVIALLLASVFVWGGLSGRLERADLTAPIVFVTLGWLLSLAVDVPELGASRGTIEVLAEVTLVWVLFSDAAGVPPAALRADAPLFGRLLGVGLPLTVAAGTGLAYLLFDGGWWIALLVGAALAPTDAALGLPVVTSPAVPARIRRTLNVESGLNDGIVAPVVTIAIAGAAGAATVDGPHGVEHAALEILVGLGVGLATGTVCGRLLRTAKARHWTDDGFTGPAVLALALFCFTAATSAEGNGFIAAFVGGLAFGATSGRSTEPEIRYVERTAGMSSLVTWLMFGATAVPLAFGHLDWRVSLYTVASLTVLRMVPVAVALLGTRLSWRTVTFVGWFGPRGMASVIFALLALEALNSTRTEHAVTVITLTVLASTFLHGLTSAPLTTRYGNFTNDAQGL